MKSYRWLRRSALMSLVALPVLLSACGWGGKDDTSGAIDPPQIDYEADWNMDDWIDAEVMAPAAETAPVTVYVEDPHGYVVPVGLRLPAEAGIARLVLQHMVDGGPASGLLPTGFRALLPKGTDVLGLDIRNGSAIIDFSEAFTSYNPGDERKIIEAVTWAMTGFPTIERVQLWVEGRPLKDMPVNETPVDVPLTRDIGINIESSPGLNLAQAAPVTLYFMNETEEDYQYYVPVTRLVAHTGDMADLTVAELIRGPLPGSELLGVMNPEAQLLDVEASGDVVTVNFADQLLQHGVSAPERALEALVLSVTEQTGAAKVQVMIGGQAAQLESPSANYAAPVSRPSRLNPLGV